ncbi:Gfo/Idh/MocA family protein [Nevskia soli]|jgi:predicted dehydrogenase|uniref:Gfo/Idh/MocA family protein n=1 Tax=Nevskia soli TaxID=418856 RepID=UPI0015D95955|nr:Gfo/Idh/MocA family oxidoreductase [Nevskia soli]
MPKPSIAIGMVGYKFMGKAHSNAYRQINQFFDLPLRTRLKTIVGRDANKVAAMAERWGWETSTDDWRRVIDDPEIRIVDICSPNNTHYEVALAALDAGKIVACEKPLAMNGAQAREMAAAARGKINTVWFNYRRVPAIAFARQLIDEGRIGRIFHFRALYLQDWTLDPSVPLLWRMDKDVAGSGVTGDLHSHIVDLSNYLAGEITAVAGTSRIFVNERSRPEGGASKVEIEDASIFVAKYADGAIGHFEATRFANGRKNGNTFEINGEHGSLYFDLEDMSRLWYFDSREPKHIQGWRKISVWEEMHPYMKQWWVPGCAIGYEHTFGNQAADLIAAVAADRPMKPDFDDGLRCQLVLDAVLEACESDRWVTVVKQ